MQTILDSLTDGKQYADKEDSLHKWTLDLSPSDFLCDWRHFLNAFKIAGGGPFDDVVPVKGASNKFHNFHPLQRQMFEPNVTTVPDAASFENYKKAFQDKKFKRHAGVMEGLL